MDASSPGDTRKKRKDNVGLGVGLFFLFLVVILIIVLCFLFLRPSVRNLIAIGDKCEDTQQCVIGGVCSAGSCRLPPGSSCTTSDQCDGNSICDETCKTISGKCDDGNQCVTGFCNKGKCSTKPVVSVTETPAIAFPVADVFVPSRVGQPATVQSQVITEAQFTASPPPPPPPLRCTVNKLYQLGTTGVPVNLVLNGTQSLGINAFTQYMGELYVVTNDGNIRVYDKSGNQLRSRDLSCGDVSNLSVLDDGRSEGTILLLCNGDIYAISPDLQRLSQIFMGTSSGGVTNLSASYDGLVASATSGNGSVYTITPDLTISQTGSDGTIKTFGYCSGTYKSTGPNGTSFYIKGTPVNMQTNGNVGMFDFNDGFVQLPETSIRSAGMIDGKPAYIKTVSC
jgi:hypothetical protein